LETLAIIAYKQPIIRSDVEHIRGVDCGGVLRQLLERKLIRVLGRKEIAGRPLIYATTRKFLETFDLRDLRDLPTPKEIEEFGKAPLEMRGNITIEPDEDAQLTGDTGSETPEEATAQDKPTVPADQTLPEQTEILSDMETPPSDETTSEEADKPQEPV